jgi:hypothetical protein
MSTLMSQARTRVPRFADAAAVRARLVLVPARATTARRAPFVVLIFGLLGGGLVGPLMFNTNMQQASFHVTRLQQQATALTAQQQALDMQLERLRDPQRLARAGRQLGMVAPPEPAFVRLSDGKVLGTPTVATPNDAVHIHAYPAAKPKSLSPAPLVIRVKAPAAKTTGTSAGASPNSATAQGRKGASTHGTASTAGTSTTPSPGAAH